MSMSNQLIIAIDGYSGCGKSTLAKALAKELGYIFIDTGAMYRAVTLYFLQEKINFQDEEAIQKALQNIHIHFQKEHDGLHTFLNGKDVESDIRRMYVSENVSEVAAISSVRRALVKQQQLMGQEGGVILDGRDIGTVVFKNADLKLFVTADADVRAKRRLAELEEKGYTIDFESVKRNLLERDHIDMTRDDSPLKKADDAIVLDNTHLSELELLGLALDLAMARMSVNT